MSRLCWGKRAKAIQIIWYKSLLILSTYMYVSRNPSLIRGHRGEKERWHLKNLGPRRRSQLRTYRCRSFIHEEITYFFCTKVTKQYLRAIKWSWIALRTISWNGGNCVAKLGESRVCILKGRKLAKLCSKFFVSAVHVMQNEQEEEERVTRRKAFQVLSRASLLKARHQAFQQHQRPYLNACPLKRFALRQCQHHSLRFAISTNPFRLRQRTWLMKNTFASRILQA